MYKRIRTLEVKLSHIGQAKRWAQTWNEYINKNYDNVTATASLAFYGEANQLYCVITAKSMADITAFSESRLNDEGLMDILRQSLDSITNVLHDVVTKDI